MKGYIYFPVFVILLVSCEYHLEETNYRDIEPPSEYAMMEVNLNDVYPLDTIYIWGPTRFSLSLTTGQLIYQADVTFNGYPVDVSNLSSQSIITFMIYPGNYGNFKLTVECITSSGTRSLADLLGFEGYTFETYWNIKFVDISNYFTGGYRILEDGQVELYWDNSLLPDSEIISCYLERSSSDQEELKPWQKSVIINDYVCGEKIYTITTYTTSSVLYSGEIVIDTPIPKIYIEDINQNKLRVYWDRPAVANAKYAVRTHYYTTSGGDMGKISDITDTTVTVPKPELGYSATYTVDFFPSKPRNETLSVSSEISFFYGKKVGADFRNNFLYNTTENVVYAVVANAYPKNISIIDPNTLDYYHLELEVTAAGYATSTNSSRFAVIGSDKLYVYNDSKFLSPIIIERQNIYASYTLTDEFLFEFTNNAYNIYIYDLTNSSKINMPPYFENGTKMSIDGRYFAWHYSGNTIYFSSFDFPNFTSIASYVCPQRLILNDYHFHPNHPDQIIIAQNNASNTMIDIYKLPQLEKLQSTNLPSGTQIFNIDPITELVVYFNGKDKFIIAPLSDLNNQLYTTPGNNNAGGVRYYLFNGCLFSSEGYAANILKELLQP